MTMGVRGPDRARQEKAERIPSSQVEAVARFYEDVVADLLPGDTTSRLRRLRYVIDFFELEFAKDSARLATDFAEVSSNAECDAVSVGDWIRHECKTSRTVAYDRLNVGLQLSRLPESTGALVAGDIGFAHLSVIARTATAIEESTPEAAFDERDLLEKARESSAGRLWYYCQRLRHALDPETVAREQRVAAEQRALRFTSWEDGSLFISGQLDPVGGAALRTAIEPLARSIGEGDDRCLERRQGDALVELAMHSLDSGLVPQRASQRPHLQVTTTLETMRGLVGSPAADLEFAPPVSSKTVQRIACDASITRVVFGPESVVVDVGRARRVVSGATRRALNARDQHCQWPGCERPASWSAAHHVEHWIEGGETNLSNLILLCLRHHWMVHEGGWRLARALDERLLAIPPTYAYRYETRVANEITPPDTTTPDTTTPDTTTPKTTTPDITTPGVQPLAMVLTASTIS
jgi:hypothetical protein